MGWIRTGLYLTLSLLDLKLMMFSKLLKLPSHPHLPMYSDRWTLIWISISARKSWQQAGGEQGEEGRKILEGQLYLNRVEEIFSHEDVDKDGFVSHDEFSGPKHDEL